MIYWYIILWVVVFILVFVSYGLYGLGKVKGVKIMYMILCLFYIIIILIGVELFVCFVNWNGEYVGKMLFGIIIIGLMEMFVICKKKGKLIGGLWIGFIIVFVLMVFFGFYLLIGFYIF